MTSRQAVSVAAFVATTAALVRLIRTRALARDPLQWLEEVDSTKALAWVEKQNKALPVDGKGKTYERILEILDSKEKIPYVGKIGERYYNFWKDDKHERGIWRCTTLNEYEKKEPKWETVIDVDALAAQDKQKWVWKGYTLLDEGNDVEPERILVKLSPGGGDAVIVREFDIKTRKFLDASQKPFVIPEAKLQVSWKDRDTLLICTDFGPGSLTSSGYPRIVKEWKRGTPLADAKTVFEGKEADVIIGAGYVRERLGIEFQISSRAPGFYSNEIYVHSVTGLKNDDGSTFALPTVPLKIPVPDDADTNYFADQILVDLRSDWKGFKSGSLLSIPMVKLLAAASPEEVQATDLQPLFTPSERVALSGLTKLKTRLLVEILDNVRSRIDVWRFDAGGRKWIKDSVPEGQDGRNASMNMISTWALDGKHSDLYWSTTEGYTLPCTLSLVDVTGTHPTKVLKQEPTRYDAKDIVVEQFQATSKDGTLIPYFQVGRKSSSSSAAARPTLLYGYGGFEIPLTPAYQTTTGVSWLEKGNVYVCANIRGGGEFGPTWHQAALRENRNKAYEDFEAVAQDLIRRKVTTAAKLGIMGGSNGGLLMGNMLTRSPDLFGAVVCMVPLLDMKRYTKLLAGASWIAEYGDPDTSDWDFLQNYSPYHKLKAGTKYPPVLFTTSTRDDRVAPAHSRKMAKKMMDMGIKDVFHYENVEGGHGGASTNAQRAYMWTLCYQFLDKYLVDKGSNL
ncbi:Prolyl endopeptidase [Hondaea fermentalgiana]|uniref:Prolyl endopeptidase n=1 Tax=Hondaea fermentalgiana TaxID=2315210 RepID=A0A2R5GHC7_9STRA|nr:Prolyl endopeptidase [Hondaea fermentalgiana]|eukprot:GBG29739.1 Prolyl endopeptidase [Hondaea fermentalgiana]